MTSLKDLIRYITTFNDEKKIENLEYWVELADDTQKLLRAWTDSDTKRWYKQKEEKAKLEQAFLKLKSMPFGVVKDTANHGSEPVVAFAECRQCEQCAEREHFGRTQQQQCEQ